MSAPHPGDAIVRGALADARPAPFWSDRPDLPAPGAPLTGRVRADLAIVGGGFTGLWTAYYLKRLAPDLSVCVLEAGQVGFGASGRNGGWCSALFPASAATIAAEYGNQPAVDMQRAMFDTIDEVERVVLDPEVGRSGDEAERKFGHEKRLARLSKVFRMETSLVLTAFMARSNQLARFVE